MSTNETEPVVNFIRRMVEDDLASSKYEGRVVTRFPPEPNGYLHIGHAKSICLNFGIARDYKGKCHLRMDDTNPETEDVEYVESIMQDIRWLGFDWGQNMFYASDYYEPLYAHAEELIRKGKAYVCQLTTEQFKEYRGVPTAPGKESPWRNRTVEENLDLFRRMKAGEFEEGAYVLRAKVDMTSPNLHLRDPVMYRIKKVAHHRTGTTWCIYPMYDYAHCVSDSIEKITHSICTLEFEVHRPLYDWFLEQLGLYRPQQIEFARLNLTYTVMSKRKLQELVADGLVRGWDDPRLPTVAGLRRRGYTPEAIREFAERVGVTKMESLSDVALLEHCLRDYLNKRSPRVMGVMRPLKVVIDNYPEGQVEEFEAVNNPEDPSAGTRKVPFSKVIYIEQDDFREEPPKGFFRLAPGKEVRLRYAYYVKYVGVVKDATGAVTEVHCSYDPESRGGGTPDGRKVKGTIHWVSAAHAVKAEARLYDRLFSVENPAEVEAGRDWKETLNAKSLEVVECLVEPSLGTPPPDGRFQFERLGYFCVDSDSKPGQLVFNRTVTLRDTWSKVEKGQ